MKQFKWPTSLISHWFPVEMVHNGPKLCKRRRHFLCCKTFSEVSIHCQNFMTHPDRFLNSSWHCVLSALSLGAQETLLSMFDNTLKTCDENTLALWGMVGLYNDGFVQAWLVWMWMVGQCAVGFSYRGYCAGRYARVWSPYYGGLGIVQVCWVWPHTGPSLCVTSGTSPPHSSCVIHS